MREIRLYGASSDEGFDICMELQATMGHLTIETIRTLPNPRNPNDFTETYLQIHHQTYLCLLTVLYSCPSTTPVSSLVLPVLSWKS